MSKCKCTKLAILCCLFWANLSFAQQNSYVVIDSVDVVEILSSKKVAPLPIDYIEIGDNLTLIPVDRALEQNSAVYFKKYGAGQLSGISLNGMNSAQTNVVWNGLNLNSSMIGQTDFSTIPTNNISGITITSAIDNLGGAVQMNSDLYLKEPWSLSAKVGVGSFGLFTSSLDYTRKINSYSSKTSVSLRTVKNDFKYLNRSIAGGIESNLNNALTQQFGLGHSMKLNYKSHRLQLHYLQAINKRQLPPTVFESNSTASQDDNLYAVVLTDRLLLKEGVNLKTQVGYQFQSINFKLSDNSDSDLSKMGSLQSLLGLFHEWKRMNFEYQVRHTFEHGNIEAYNKRQFRNQVLTGVNVRCKSLYHNFNSGVHLNAYSGGKATLLPDISYSVIHNRMAKSEVKVAYAHHTRVPTLNDLFWVPGGEPDLEAEQSKQIDLSWTLSDYFADKKISYDLSIANHHILATNFIQWQPTSNGYWSPINLGEVYSRGMNLKLRIIKDLNKDCSVEVLSSYAISRITMKQSNTQLVYVPQSQLLLAPSIKWKTLRLDVINRFTSSVIATNNEALASFFTMDLRLSHELKLKNSGYGIGYYVGLLNATNTNYEVVLNRPMAPLSFELGAAFTLIGKK